MNKKETLIDQFKTYVGAYYGVNSMDEYDLKVYVLKEIEKEIINFIEVNDLEKEKLIDALEANIQKIHIPEIEMTSDIELYISKGLMEAAVDLERDHMKVKEIKKL